MALTVSSTTDDQAAVNAAAGIAETPEVEAPEAARHPEKEAPAPKPAPTPAPEEEEDPGEEPAQEEEEAKAKPKGGFQRKIEKLARENEYLARRYQELEYHLKYNGNGRAHEPPQQQQPQQPAGPPRQEGYETYEAYIDALTDWKLEQALAKRSAIEQQQRQQQAQEQLLNGWHERVGRVRTELPDYNDTLDAVSHIPIPTVLGQALMSSEEGPRLAYELARKPEVLEQIVRLDPLAQLRALGKFEASLAAAAPTQAAPPRRPSVSQAPPPIRPVGQGAGNGSTVPLDEMSYQDYKRARERQIKARRTG